MQTQDRLQGDGQALQSTLEGDSGSTKGCTQTSEFALNLYKLDIDSDFKFMETTLFFFGKQLHLNGIT